MIIRSVLLLLPFAIWLSLITQQRFSRREITATLLGFVGFFLANLGLNIVCLHLDIWTLAISDNLFYGIPLDWVLSQAIILGVLIPLMRQIMGVVTLTVTARLLLQLIGMALIYGYSIDIEIITAKIVVAFVVIFLLSAVPALLLADWTAGDQHIGGRSLLQSLSWSLLLLWFFPAVVFHFTSNDWSILLGRSFWWHGIYLLPLLIPAYLLINALYHFAVYGNGTAFPYDAPKKLVTTGIYRYISNPMQLGICLTMAWWGVVLHSLSISVSAFVALALFIVFKDVCNGSCTIGINSEEWNHYQQSVPKWWPKFY